MYKIYVTIFFNNNMESIMENADLNNDVNAVNVVDDLDSGASVVVNDVLTDNTDNANANNNFYSDLQFLKNQVYDLMQYETAKSMNNEELAKELLVVDAILNNLFVKIEGVKNFVKEQLSK